MRRTNFGRPNAYIPAWRNVHPIIVTLRKRRIEIGLTQQHLADKVGYNSSVIKRFEAGEQLPRMQTFLDICDALELDVSLAPKISVAAE